VSSQARAAASRANGRKSRGPRTAAGTAKSSRNAWRHGLAAAIPKDSAMFAEIEELAKAICNGASDPLLVEQALIIAKNDLVLDCVQREWIAVIERHKDKTATPLAGGDLGFARAKARFELAKLVYPMLVGAPGKDAAGPNAASSHAAPTTAVSAGDEQMRSTRQRERAASKSAKGVTLPLERDEFDAMRAAMPDLLRLERYRRRAWSSQRRAVQRFMEIQSGRFETARTRKPLRRLRLSTLIGVLDAPA
jgi:hypothetical protein